MILRDAVAVLAVGAGWIAASPTRRVTRVVAVWQVAATVTLMALHLRGRVAWELGVRRPAYLAAVARGEQLDRGVALWLGASLLGIAVCALRWREGASPGLLRASAGATAVLLAVAAWWLRAA